MSGPKVVRIVTREELLAICHGMLARVDAALADWERVSRRNDVLDEEALASARQRRDELAAMIARDRFDVFQKEAPREEAFLLSDLDRRLGEAASRQAQERSRERRTREAGASLLRALKGAGTTLDAGLEAGLLEGDADAVSSALSLLGERSEHPDEASSEMARRLGGGGGKRTFAEWIANRDEGTRDPAVERVEARLAAIARMEGEDAVAAMRSRLEEVEDAPPARRSILLDGLEIESGRALDAARKKDAVLREARLLLAECRTAGLHVVEDEDALGYFPVDALRDWMTSTGARIGALREAAAAQARRDAVLEALGDLGYEVVEGMGTAVPEEGRIVLRSAARPDYGVEVGSTGSMGRMQMRPVAFGTDSFGPDPARDRDAETIWCGDVGSLRKALAERGDAFEIERALPVGAVALKRIDVATDDREADRTAPVMRERSRPG